MEDSRLNITPSKSDQKELNTRWEKAGIGNDFIFSCVMSKEKIFLPLIQRIFPELKLCRVEKHVAQMTANGPAGSRSVRYDVYSEIDGRVFEVEMQMESRKNEPKRTRYYQSMIDEQVLKTGEDYSKLPESCIIMISPIDLFGKGRYVYRFRNIEVTDPSLELGDKTMKVFLNSHGKDSAIRPELKNFLDLVNGEKPADEYCRAVEREVKTAKLDAETRRNFMEFEYVRMLDRIDAEKKGHESGLQEGREIGQREGSTNVLLSLVNDGLLAADEAVKRSGLSEQEFKKKLELYKSGKSS